MEKKYNIEKKIVLGNSKKAQLWTNQNIVRRNMTKEECENDTKKTFIKQYFESNVQNVEFNMGQALQYRWLESKCP